MPQTQDDRDKMERLSRGGPSLKPEDGGGPSPITVRSPLGGRTLIATAAVLQCQALARVIEVECHGDHYDHAASSLLTALADYVRSRS